MEEVKELIRVKSWTVLGNPLFVLQEGRHFKCICYNLTFNPQALRAMEQFSYMKIPPKLKSMQSDNCDKQCEFP